MAWNSITNQRAVQTTTRLVVEICRQMEEWRRLLRYVDRIEQERARERLEEGVEERRRGRITPLRRPGRRDAA